MHRLVLLGHYLDFCCLRRAAQKARIRVACALRCAAVKRLRRLGFATEAGAALALAGGRP